VIEREANAFAPDAEWQGMMGSRIRGKPPNLAEYMAANGYAMEYRRCMQLADSVRALLK
jgi:hypothetical protein